MKRHFYHLIMMSVWLLLGCPFVLADPVTPSQAQRTAQTFFQQKGWSAFAAPRRAKSRVEQTNVDAPYYIFNASGHEGFVVVSGDDALPDVLGYCETTFFSEDDAPDALRTLLEQYGQCVQTARAKGQTLRRAPAYTAVAPLLKTAWYQEVAPYNSSCPFWTDDEGNTSTQRCVVGCVATSVSQVLNYHKYPAALQDTLFGWTTAHYTIPDIPKGTSIDWANVVDEYRNGYTEAQGKALADLSYYCGVSCHMNWGLGVSGASMSNIVPNMKRAFGYKYARMYDHFLYTPQQWSAMLHRELEAGRPIIYASGNVELTSHAYNIDGCDADGLYHVNWGFQGNYNGYFDLDVLNPFVPAGSNIEDEDVAEGLSVNHLAVFLCPDSVEVAEEDTLVVLPTDVTVDSVVFRRPPDTNKYVPVDFYLHNHRTDTLAYPMEIMLYQPTDTLIFKQADYVGMTGGLLLPQQQTKVTAYCNFTAAGTYLFGYSYDDVHIPYSQPITVVATSLPNLSFDAEITNLTEDSVTFAIDIQNAAGAGWAGNLMTYCLFQEGKDEDVRHWTFLNIAPGTALSDEKTFNGLQAGTTYTLKVRCSWTVMKELTFTTPGINAIGGVLADGEATTLRIYTVDGKFVGTFPKTSSAWRNLPKGIYIVNGKKMQI